MTSPDTELSSRLGAVVASIWNRDPKLFGADPTLEPLIANRYGWLDIATRMQTQVSSLQNFAASVRSSGRKQGLLLGMGGSSLAADVMRHTLPLGQNAVPVTVLDSTHPEAVRALLASHDPSSSIYLVASKSGTTTEPLCFQQTFWAHAVRRFGETKAGESFVAITDSGSKLAADAAMRGYRRAFINPEDIGGRYSALSYFGLVPAALMGANLEALLGSAADAMAKCQTTIPIDQNPGAQLGLAMAANTRAGRNKLTLLCPRPFERFGVWVEQLIAESLGKHGGGILPIEGEQITAGTRLGNDRFFVAIDTGTGPINRQQGPAHEISADELEAAGLPVFRMAVRKPEDLGSLFFIWEFATTVAGALLGIEPFDQPNVELSKVLTRKVLDSYLKSGMLEVPPAVLASEAADTLRDQLTGNHRPDYVAIQAYLNPSASIDRALERLRLAVATSAWPSAVTIGYGPRFLHSTGQLHKGGIAGLSIQLLDQPVHDVAIPGVNYGFSALITAQSIGDFQALSWADRQIARIDLGTDPAVAIRSLADAL
ncbi:MAG: glucose-6-phosphate isomerase [Chloroflexi bacterium]|nr:glucose-6-phosphate isomerase [Chloroflexota bacterium]